MALCETCQGKATERAKAYRHQCIAALQLVKEIASAEGPWAERARQIINERS